MKLTASRNDYFGIVQQIIHKHLKCDMRHFKAKFIFSKFQKNNKKTLDTSIGYVIVRNVIKNIKNKGVIQ